MADANKEDPEVALRVRTMVKQIVAATEGKPRREVRLALANWASLLCLTTGADDPDEDFLLLSADIIEVYIAVRAHVRAGHDPKEGLN